MKDLVEKYKAMGYTRFQLKLGGNYKDDIDRIRACHSALDSQDVLIGDANTGVENTQCLKIFQNVSFEFYNFGISFQFLFH